MPENGKNRRAAFGHKRTLSSGHPDPHVVQPLGGEVCLQAKRGPTWVVPEVPEKGIPQDRSKVRGICWALWLEVAVQPFERLVDIAHPCIHFCHIRHSSAAIDLHKFGKGCITCLLVL